jgi:hypothetical protein
MCFSGQESILAHAREKDISTEAEHWGATADKTVVEKMVATLQDRESRGRPV